VKVRKPDGGKLPAGTSIEVNSLINEEIPLLLVDKVVLNS